jgi:hypothetical protein
MPKLTLHVRPQEELTDEDIGFLVDLGKKQVQLMHDIEAALVAGDERRVVALAAEMVHLDHVAR